MQVELVTSSVLRLILARRRFHSLIFLIYQSVTRVFGYYQWFIVFMWFLSGDDYIVGTSDGI
jgi:hypothetical protein